MPSGRAHGYADGKLNLPSGKLDPDEDVVDAAKVGVIRPAPNAWAPHGHPGYLRACVEVNLRRLGRERLDICYLHRIDPKVPIEDQLGTLHALKSEGKIGHIGLSKVTSEDIRLTGKYIAVVAVQNVLNVRDNFDPALKLCRDLGIPYVAYRPPASRLICFSPARRSSGSEPRTSICGNRHLREGLGVQRQRNLSH